MARRPRLRRALFYVFLALCLSFCFVDAKKKKPFKPVGPAWDLTVQDRVGETYLSGVIMERCFAEGIHRHLQIYPACQDWVRNNEAPKQLFDSMPATWMANSLGRKNALDFGGASPPPGNCDNECLLKHFAGVCHTAAKAAFGWVDLTCDAYQKDRTVETLEGRRYPGTEGPWSWFVPDPFSWGHYRTIQAVIELTVKRPAIKKLKNFDKWLPSIDEIWGKGKHRHNWKRDAGDESNIDITESRRNTVAEDEIEEDAAAGSLLKREPGIDEKESCGRRGPCGTSLPWFSSSLVPGVLEVMMNPHLTVENLHGYIGARASIPSDVRGNDQWFGRMSAILRTAVLNDVLIREHFFRYVLEAAHARGANELHQIMPVYPKHTMWRWAAPAGNNRHTPERHFRLKDLPHWHYFWVQWKLYEPYFIKEIDFDMSLLPLKGDHVYMHLSYDRKREQSFPQYLKFVSTMEEEPALTKNHVLEFEVLDNDMKPTGQKVYRRAKEVHMLSRFLPGREPKSTTVYSGMTLEIVATAPPSAPSVTTIHGTPMVLETLFKPSKTTVPVTITPIVLSAGPAGTTTVPMTITSFMISDMGAPVTTFIPATPAPVTEAITDVDLPWTRQRTQKVPPRTTRRKHSPGPPTVYFTTSTTMPTVTLMDYDSLPTK